MKNARYRAHFTAGQPPFGSRSMRIRIHWALDPPGQRPADGLSRRAECPKFRQSARPDEISYIVVGFPSLNRNYETTSHTRFSAQTTENHRQSGSRPPLGIASEITGNVSWVSAQGARAWLETSGRLQRIGEGRERRNKCERLIGQRLGAKAAIPLCRPLVLGFDDDHQDAADRFRHPQAAQCGRQQAAGPRPLARNRLVMTAGTTSCATDAGARL